jgi:hypothetical protein
MEVPPDAGHNRIDLDRVDVLGALGERERGIVAAARADHQDLLEGPIRQPAMDLPMEVQVRGIVRADHRLQPDAVHEQVDGLTGAPRSSRDAPPVVVVRGDPVVGRPQVRSGRLGADEDEDAGHRRGGHGGPDRDPAAEREEADQDRHHREPRDRLEPGDREQAEPRDPGQRAHDVDAVRPQRRQASKQPTEREGKRRHQRDDEPHDQRQHQEVRVGAGAVLEAEEDLVLGIDLHVELRPQDQQDHPEQQQCERRDRQPRPGQPQQDSQADAEEARDQDEVAEIADVDDVRRDPANEQQLDEEQRGARQEQPDLGAGQDRDRRDEHARAAEPHERRRLAQRPRRNPPSSRGARIVRCISTRSSSSRRSARPGEPTRPSTG